MNYSVNIAPYIQFNDPLESTNTTESKSCKSVNCVEMDNRVSFELKFCSFCGSELVVEQNHKKTLEYPDAYDFCEEYLPEDLSEFFCSTGDGEFDDKWLFNYGLENVDDPLEFDLYDSDKSFLDLNSINIKNLIINIKNLIKNIKLDPNAKVALKILDEKIGSENYSISVGVFSTYS